MTEPAINQDMGDLDKGVYLSGFARGGTTWARQILSAPEGIFEVPRQVGFKPPAGKPLDRRHMAARLNAALDNLPDAQAARKALSRADRFVVKAPPNALIMAEIMEIVPKAKHVFIMRDPRDVLVSHQKTGVAWTEAHAAFDMAMERTAAFYRGYEKAKGRDNLFVFRYEDVHQKFPSTFKQICDFLEVDISEAARNAIMHKLSFRAVTGRAHEERKGMNRRGVSGDWVKNLSWSDGRRFEDSPFWQRVMREHGYDWQTISLADILGAAHAAERPSAGLAEDRPGLHMLWSLSDARWDNMEAVSGIYRRCRKALQLSQDQGLDYSFMVNGEIPARLHAPLRKILGLDTLSLEVNLDQFPQDPARLIPNLKRLIRDCLPTIKGLGGDQAPMRCILLGENRALYTGASTYLRGEGFEVHSLYRPELAGRLPFAWVSTDAANTLTLSGQGEGFDAASAQDWQTLAHAKTWVIGKMTAASQADPLSFGFRTCFDDVNGMA